MRNDTILTGFLAALVLIACGGGSDEPQVNEPGCASTIDHRFAINYLEGLVTLRADDLLITANSEPFHEQVQYLFFDYDPGDATYTTLTVAWAERDQLMLLDMHFTSDGSDWWVDQIRTSDGTFEGRSIFYQGEFFRCPLGQYFSGDIELQSTEAGGVPGTIRFDNLWLRAFVDDEPPGALPGVIEAAARPVCHLFVDCGSYFEPFNSCLYYFEGLGPAIRPEVYATAMQCAAGLGCDTIFDQQYAACWESAQPAPLPYHDAFRQACETRTQDCFGAPDSHCEALGDGPSTIDLAYYSEEFVTKLSTCVAEDIACADLEVGNCMDGIGIQHHLDF